MWCERALSLSHGAVAFLLLKLLPFSRKLLRELWVSDSLLDHCSLRLSREFLFVALAQFQFVSSSDELFSLSAVR